jgi:protease-4
VGIVTILVLVFAVSTFGCIRSLEDKIAVIPLEGVIANMGQEGLLTSVGIDPDLVRDFLERAEKDGSVKAVVLRIDSPGGSAAASQEIAGDIRSFKERTGKPVVVSMGGTAASGGYYISAYADKIVANPSTLTGSIGVISQFIYFDGLLEKVGLELEIVKAGKFKGMGIRPLSDEERRIMQAITDELYNQFVAAVADGRNIPVADVKELATGQVYTGTQALELGLVDEMGGLNEAIDITAALAGLKDPEVEEYSRPSFSFPGGFFGNLFRPAPPRLSGDELLFMKMLEGWQAMPRY